jgi:hypothetical protein
LQQNFEEKCEMKVNIEGSPEDLIKKCKGCKYCIFEDILANKQRKIKVLDCKIPKNHVHRIIIEQICGKQYDEVCPMKYAAMRAFCDDRTAMQMGVVKNYIWDLGKKYHKKIEYRQALKDWTTSQDLGRNIIESYAERYNEIWALGVRIVKEDDEIIQKQVLTADLIYEMVMAKTRTYREVLALLKTLIVEHKERDET